jgi:deoxyribose-phosphate aldolase
MISTSSSALSSISYEQVAQAIDHSLLRPDLTIDDIASGCAVAARYEVASVCARPADVPRCVEALRGSSVAVGTVIGFPHGAHTTRVKVFEAETALADGATELDMVLNIGLLRSGRLAEVEDDIRAVVAASGDAIVKVILENAYLDHHQKVAGCRAAEAAGADFVKTSTGFAPGGATMDDLRLMRATVSPHIQVKAAGGVRTLDALLEVLAVGVTRVGATRTAEILDDYRARTSG